jgi:hypothetical protein
MLYVEPEIERKETGTVHTIWRSKCGKYRIMRSAINGYRASWFAETRVNGRWDLIEKVTSRAAAERAVRQRAAEDVAAREYLDDKSRVLKVSQDYDWVRGVFKSWFGTRWIAPDGEIGRMKRPELPKRKTRDEAQADLNLYARANRLEAI